MAVEETAPTISFFEVMRVSVQDAYTLDEMKTLCHDLTVNYEDLGGETRSAKAREIVNYFKRNGRLADLMDYCRRTRVDVDWPKPPPGVQVASAFTVLKEMLEGDVDLRDAVNDFKHNFEAAHKHIGVVNFFKSLHDRLHRLQVMCYDPLMDEIRRTADVREALESISKYIDYFKKIVDELRKISPIKTYDSSWINQLAQAQIRMALSATPDDFDPGEIKKAARDTNHILSVHPGKINGRLMGAIATLDLSTLQEAMENVSQQFTRFNLDQEKIKEFKDGITSLETLNSRLLELTREHDLWQDADRVLRRVDELIDSNEISELETVWPDLRPQIANIFENSAEEWAVRLKVQSEKLDQALKANPRDPKLVKDLFDKYRQLAVQRFFKVDEQVLSLCSGLVGMDNRLTLLLEKM